MKANSLILLVLFIASVGEAYGVARRAAPRRVVGAWFVARPYYRRRFNGPINHCCGALPARYYDCNGCNSCYCPGYYNCGC